jgi:superfamily II DNA or RNA helicase/tetratricopeptide (TPR) repeat protein
MTGSLFDEHAFPHLLPRDEHCIAQAMALLWTFRPRTSTYDLLRLLGLKRDDGRMFTLDDVKHVMQKMRRHGQLVDHSSRQGFYRLENNLRVSLYAEILQQFDTQKLCQALYELDGYKPENTNFSWPVYDPFATIGIVRIALLSGSTHNQLERLKQLVSRSMEWNGILLEAVLTGFDGDTFARITPEWRWGLCYSAVWQHNERWDISVLPVAEWCLKQLADQAAAMPLHLHLALAELLLNQGKTGQASALLSTCNNKGAAQALQAYTLAQQGQWAEAQARFESALKLRQVEVAARKRVFPHSLAWIYPLVLLAQQTPRHLDLARKFCVSESGKRSPDPSSGWGLWVHAIDVRRGDVALHKSAFDISLRYANRADMDHLWRVLLAAWLGPVVLGTTANKPTVENLSALAKMLTEHLNQCNFEWLARMVDAAAAIFNNQEPPPGFFVSGKAERWREVLSALQSLAGEKSTPADATTTTRLVWAITIGKAGSLDSIVPLEQKHGTRGWNKPKTITLAKIAADNHLSPWDAKVARAIRQNHRGARYATLDLSAALTALIGHPSVVLANRPEHLIDLTEGVPELEVIKSGDKVTLMITPTLRAPEPDKNYYWDVEEKRDAENLRLITLVEDTPQRVRAFRFTPAQRRAAQLLAENMIIPAAAQEELQLAMHALTSHFQVHADHLQAAREVPADARLRAELSPMNEGLLLRLVVTPLGTEGPRLVPGNGRARLMASVAGESIGTTRELEVEKSHLAAVLDALPFLDDPVASGNDCEWDVPDPEQALALVEILPALPAIAALDWPKGKSVRVISVDLNQLAVKVTSERNWFKIEGEAKVDEGLVFTFEALLAASRNHSRFLPMGNGVYAALTRTLKERLSDLASVAETDKHGTHIPLLAAAWLDDALDGAELKSDKEFRNALEKLRQAQEQVIPLPRTLQAELRPYQEDGYVWASRLAQAGFGGCLADDMGLGKTLQSLAILLARSEGGPALIIAPTSVCGNWVAEALRFAPSLTLRLYGEDGRDSILTEAAAFDVVVVSYTLLQQSSEKFAARKWHTIIADEAQAIKNATTKRTQAVFELDANFRLALSGTPVENRLSDLWSIMRFANPGLLGTLARFNERFVITIERDKDRDAQQTLRRLISPFLLRRIKSQVLHELPPRTEQIIKIESGKEEASHYEALRRQAMAEADLALASNTAGQARMNILAQLTRLRRAACDPRIVTPAFPFPGAKVQTFANLAAVLVANGHKALVFSQFVDFLTLLREPLDAAGITYQYLDGSTPAAERTRRVASFQAGVGDLFLISLKAGGFGLNLTAADYVVITDPWWNPAAEDQAMGRAHRIGQLRPVTVYRLVTKGTVEEHIVGLHNDKRSLAESILGEGDAAHLPSTQELMDLIKG